jgi:group I intron endonuclease
MPSGYPNNKDLFKVTHNNHTKYTGIYTIINKLDNKIYVGYAKDIYKRLLCHRSYLINNVHKNEHLQLAWNKYGEENFLFEILEECEERFLTSQEHYWVTILNTLNNKFGYNIRPTHPHDKCKSNSEETKRKISQKHIGKTIHPNCLKGLEVGRIIAKGRPMHPNRLKINYKKVIDIQTGVIYTSITEAAIKNEYNMTYLSNMLTGAKKNTTSLRYYI